MTNVELTDRRYVARGQRSICAPLMFRSILTSRR
jgi:hypothetical protein